MDGQNTVTVTIGGSAVRVVLLEDAAPRICSAFRASLPLDSFAVHAKFAGEELIAMLPFYEGPENEVPSVAPGDIGYYPARQTLCLFYGEIMPFASVSLFARVHPDDLGAAQEAGRAVLSCGPAPVSIGCGTGLKAPLRRGLAAGIESEVLRALDDIWSHEPEDVSALRSFERPPMGNMPCVLYANFDLFWIVENLLVFRGLASDEALSPKQLVRTMAALTRKTQSRLAHWGFPEACALLERVSDHLYRSPRPTRRGLVALIDSLVLYTNRLQSWVDAMAPWGDMDSLELARPAHGEPPLGR